MPLFFLVSILLATILAPRVSQSEAGVPTHPTRPPHPASLQADGRRRLRAWEKGGGAVSLLDPATGPFQYEAFLHLLLRETGRGTRYRDFFTLCLFKPDVAPADAEFEPAIEVALSTRVAEFIRSTDIVGRFPMGLGVLLLHTGPAEAIVVAERVRTAVRRVEFRRGPDLPPIQVTLSAGLVSFPRDGQTSTTLLTRAKRYLEQARQHGGDKVVHGS